MSRSRDAVTAVVLAAGHGKRLRPVTHWLPKPLVPVSGEPMLVTNLRHLSACGIPEAVVVYGRPTVSIPDFLQSVPLPAIRIIFARQKEQRGTGDALLTGIRAVGAREAYLLMAGDALYTREHIESVWGGFAPGDVDGCLLLKHLPVQRLHASSVVVLDEAGMICRMVSKPSPADIKRYGSTLADASLQLYVGAVEDYLRGIPLSRSNELEVTSALVEWMADGARLRGVTGEAPVHVTDLRDFIAHNVPFGRRMVAAAELARAIEDCSDEDLTEHLRSLEPSDVPFVYRRLKDVSGSPMGSTRQARALALISEMLRLRAAAPEAAEDAEVDRLSSTLAPMDLVAALEPQLLRGDTDPALCHRLAAAYARVTNQFIGDAVFAEAQARVPDCEEIGTPFRQRVRVRTPARLAFSSSQGSDVSFIIEEKSAVILNCAIKVGGELPGSIVIDRVETPHIELRSRDPDETAVVTDCEDVFRVPAPDDPLILLRAGLRFAGVIRRDRRATLTQQLEEAGGGFRVEVGCRIPRGSGLGCSAILAAGLVRGLREFAGLPTSDADLLVRSYCCERYYGRSGYQDIIGGVLGGVKLIQADASTGLFEPRIDRLDLPAGRLAEVPERLLVFHTGRAHVRQPYLLTIPAKYFSRSSDYMYAYENGKQLTHAMADALVDGNWERLGRLINEYWDDREHFEEGVTPDFAERLRADLAPWAYGTALCGSGHGGYMMVVPRSGQRSAILRYLHAHGITDEQVLDFGITSDGLQVETE